MHLLKKSVIALALLFLWALPTIAMAAPLSIGSGNFIFTDSLSGLDKPVSVWYYKPAGLNATAKVMFVMHGVDRNGEQYRDHWKRHAEKYKFMLVAPEFPEKYFSTNEYQFGNVSDSDKKRWTFWVVEHLFDVIRQRESLEAEKYYLYGHSAGAQFVHRLMIFMPSPRVEVAFSANAGTYTMPVYPSERETPFPMSLDKKLINETQLAAVFARRLVVMVGENDVEESGGHVPRSSRALEQGKNRFDRGQNFFRVAQSHAARLGVPLNWEMVTVQGIGHSDTGMSKAAMQYLFGERSLSGGDAD